jgi:iron only hydrogenase large subunit-like protein
MTPDRLPLVYTEKEICKTCYTCVRGCPAKAIRIFNGQAEIIEERCINCANCVLMCSRGAKRIKSSVDDILNLLKSGAKTAICLAPSFPVELSHATDATRLAGMLRKMGFSYVNEVSFGADIVSLQCRKLINENPGKKYISSACPAVVSYIEKYYPSLIPNIAPIISPMIATARIMHKIYGNDIKIVFAGPCVAKKGEVSKYSSDLDYAITFSELREILAALDITIENSMDSHFDPPFPAKGVLYALGGGLLCASEFEEDLMSGRFMSAEGLDHFPEALRDFENGDLKADFLDLLCCDGCIMGPGMTVKTSKHARENKLREYARKRYFNMKINEWEEYIRKFRDMDYSTSFCSDDKRLKPPSKEKIKAVLEKMGKFNPEDELNCGACGYSTCVEHATAIIKGLAESEMCLPYSIDRLKLTASELTNSYKQLGKTRQALIQSEKMASMGQLAASIAHELNNPLGVVMLYSNLISEDLEKNSPFQKDIKTIVGQAQRCKKIVADLLNFARKNKLILKKVDIGGLIKNYFAMAQLSSKIKIVIKKKKNVLAESDPDQLTQVISNLGLNAAEAISGKGKIIVSVFAEKDKACFSIADTGCGIKEDNLKKIFEPFFTTKQIGKGTGLGLAVSYGIIKAHNGTIIVESNTDLKKGPAGTVFTVKIPLAIAEETKYSFISASESK